MSPKNTTSPPTPDPYKIKDIKRAMVCLKTDVTKGSLGFLKRRLKLTEPDSFQNVWEGSQGKMKHVKSSFPMPAKVEPEVENSQGNTDSDIKNVGQSSSSRSKSTSLNSNASKTTGKNKNTEVSQISQPSSSSSPSITTAAITINDSVVSDSEEEDCVIIETEKIEIDIEDNDNSVSVKDCQVPSCSSPNRDDSVTDDFTHWQRLSKLHGKITEAQQRLRKIEFMFQYDQSPVKACTEIGHLRGHIIMLIKQLKQAKDDIDNGNFRGTMSPNTKKKYFEDNNKTFKRSNSSYTSIWSLFKSFCNEFVSVRERWKDILVENKGFQSSSPQELQSSIQSIKFDIAN